MKPTRILLFILIFTFFGAKAQRFRVGLSLGGNLTDVDGTDQTDNDDDFQKIGFSAGGFVNTKLGTNNILQLEINYTQKGGSQPPDSTNNNNYYKLILNYADVALTIRHRVHININKKPFDKFDIEGGIGVERLIYSQYTAKSIVTPIDLNSTDASLFIGTAYNFSENICIDFRYYNSLIPAVKRDAVNSQSLYYGSWNRGDNLVFQLTLKVTFGGDANAENPSANPTISTSPDN
jgi:opacity protein-like surface antigen